MAIKVGGTTVVDDSRGLTNIATVDATTAAAISAAGVGGGGEHDFVASGAIANGDVVTLNADGTVSVITQTTPGPNSFTQYSSSVYQSVATYDSTNNKIVVAYNKHTDSFHADAVVGTVSGTSISFGTPVEFNAAYTDNLTIGFDVNAGKVLIAYSQSSDGRAIVGTVSGTSISFGSPVQHNTSGTSYVPSLAYDANAQKMVLFYRDGGNNNYGTAVVATISGTSVSFGTKVAFSSNGTTYPTGAAYHAAAQKVVCIYQDWGNSFRPYGIVGTVSGTSISFGSATLIDSTGSGDEPSCVYDSVNQKIVASYYNDGGTNKITAAVGTVSGTSITFGTPVGLGTSLGPSETSYLDTTYDVNLGKVIFNYRDPQNSTYGYFATGTVSGTSISFSDPTVSTSYYSERGFVVYDENATKTAIGWRDGSSSPFPGKAATINTLLSTTADSYIGIAAEDISDTATGAVTIDGGVNEQTVNSYDLANASYDSVNFSVSGQETIPKDVFFKPDGTKMYICGTAGRDVNEYSLSTAWDVSTASYVQSFSVSSQTLYPNGLFFKPDGTKMYIAAQATDQVYEYTLSTAWDVSTASYLQAYNVATQVSVAQGLFFKSDGTKMYVLGSSDGYVNEYSLSTAWDISSSSYTQNYSVYSREYDASGISIKPDGTRMYVVGSSGDDVTEYSLSTAWDISTSSFIREFSVAGQETGPQGIFIKPDGTKMYIIGYVNDTVYQYTTGTFGGYTINASHFVADDGSLTTTNNGRKIGRGISTTELLIDSAMTGDETNEYLGSLV